MKAKLSASALVLFLFIGCCRTAPIYSVSEFETPEMKWRPIPLWFWNDSEVTEEGIELQLSAMIEIARSYGARISLYDEYGFPSGSMGAKHGDGRPRLMEKHPGMTLKRLDKDEYHPEPGESLRVDLGALEGKVMAVVSMRKSTGEVVSLRDCVIDNILGWTPADTSWTAMVFRCVVDGSELGSPERHVGDFRRDGQPSCRFTLRRRDRTVLEGHHGPDQPRRLVQRLSGHLPS